MQDQALVNHLRARQRLFVWRSFHCIRHFIYSLNAFQVPVFQLKNEHSVSKRVEGLGIDLNSCKMLQSFQCACGKCVNKPVSLNPQSICPSKVNLHNIINHIFM